METHEAFKAAVHRFTVEATQNPTAFRRSVVLLIVKGYVVLIGITFGFAAMAAAACDSLIDKRSGLSLLIGFFYGVPSALIAYSGTRSMLVRLELPGGVEVSRSQAPRLWGVVQSLRSRLSAPPIHRILISSELNAYMVQRARLGIFGWYENILTLGHPLLCQLPPNEMEAVIARELGFATGGRGRFGGWVYRVRATWSQVAQRSACPIGIVTSFFNGFMPGFLARTFVLARAQEYEADAEAMKVSGAVTTASSLVRLSTLCDGRMQVFFAEYWRQALRAGRLPPAVMAAYGAHLRTPADAVAVERALNDAWNAPDGVADTHPRLKDRLTAMGLPVDHRPACPALPSVTASEAWLSEELEAFLAGLDANWHKEVEPHFPEYLATFNLESTQRQTLEAKGELTPDDRYTLAHLVSQHDGMEAALPIFQSLCEIDHPGSLAVLGRSLVESGDAAGLEFLKRLVRLEPRTGLLAAQLTASFHAVRGDVVAGKQWQARVQAETAISDRANAERQAIPAADRAGPHLLPMDEVTALARRLAELKVTQAWLMRIAVEHQPDRPFFVLLVTVKVSFWSFGQSHKREQEVVATIAEWDALPHETLVLGTREQAAPPLHAKACSTQDCRILG